MTNGQGDDQFVLTLSGNGINVDLKLDRTKALRVLSVVLGNGEAHANFAGHEVSTPVTAPASTQTKISLREYLNEVRANRKPDQIATIANYLLKYEGNEDFEKEDIKSRFASAREPLPSNFSRDFNWTIKNGWIAEVHGKVGRFYLTSSGSQAIKSRFSSEIKKATTADAKTGLSRRRREQIF